MRQEDVIRAQGAITVFEKVITALLLVQYPQRTDAIIASIAPYSDYSGESEHLRLVSANINRIIHSGITIH